MGQAYKIMQAAVVTHLVKPYNQVSFLILTFIRLWIIDKFPTHWKHNVLK